MGHESDSGTPWWARSIKYYGPLTVGFFLLLFVILGIIPTSIRDAWADISIIKAQQVANRATAAAEHKELESTMEKGNRLLRGICYGTNRDLPRAEQDALCNH